MLVKALLGEPGDMRREPAHRVEVINLEYIAYYRLVLCALYLWRSNSSGSRYSVLLFAGAMLWGFSAANPMAI